MKRWILIFVLCLTVGTVSYTVWAQQQGDPGKMGNMKMDRMMSDQNRPQWSHDGMCMMHGHMMGGMMQRSMVALEGGGVCVLVGDELMKFDKDLQLVKTVDVPFDMEKMEKKMKKMMDKCDMCRQMRQEPKERI